MVAIEGTVSCWNSAVSLQQIEFYCAMEKGVCVGGGDQLISQSWKAADGEKYKKKIRERERVVEREHSDDKGRRELTCERGNRQEVEGKSARGRGKVSG